MRRESQLNKVQHTINAENDTRQYAKEVDAKEVEIEISVDDFEDMELDFETTRNKRDKSLLHYEQQSSLKHIGENSWLISGLAYF